MGWRRPVLSHLIVSSRRSLLSVLLGADITIVTTLALAAVFRLHGETSVTLAANHLLAFVARSEGSERGLNLDDTDTATAETEHEMEGRLLLDVVIRKSAAVLELLAGEDQTLLIGRNTFLVLNLGPASKRKETMVRRCDA